MERLGDKNSHTRGATTDCFLWYPDSQEHFQERAGQRAGSGCGKEENPRGVKRCQCFD